MLCNAPVNSVFCHLWTFAGIIERCKHACKPHSCRGISSPTQESASSPMIVIKIRTIIGGGHRFQPDARMQMQNNSTCALLRGEPITPLKPLLAAGWSISQQLHRCEACMRGNESQVRGSTDAIRLEVPGFSRQ